MATNPQLPFMDRARTFEAICRGRAINQGVQSIPIMICQLRLALRDALANSINLMRSAVDANARLRTITPPPSRVKISTESCVSLISSTLFQSYVVSRPMDLTENPAGVNSTSQRNEVLLP